MNTTKTTKTTSELDKAIQTLFRNKAVRYSLEDIDADMAEAGTLKSAQRIGREDCTSVALWFIDTILDMVADEWQEAKKRDVRDAVVEAMYERRMAGESLSARAILRRAVAIYFATHPINL